MSSFMKDEMSKRMDEYERLARRIASEAGQDPDQLVVSGHPVMVHTPVGMHHHIDIANARPLWLTYLPLARTALGVELK